MRTRGMKNRYTNILLAPLVSATSTLEHHEKSALENGAEV